MERRRYGHQTYKKRKEIFPLLRKDGELKERLTVVFLVFLLESGACGIVSTFFYKLAELAQKEQQRQEELAAPRDIHFIQNPTPEINP